VRRLLIRPGGIGDCLLCLPAMERLRADYTEVWCPSAVVPLMRFADRAEGIASTGLDSLGIPCLAPPASVVERLRRFDSIVSWYGTNRESFQQAVFRLGLPFEFRPALPQGGSQHAVDFFLGEASHAYPRLPFPTAARREPRIVIHPFSGGARKNWPLERFRSVAARLPLPVQWSAGPEERLDAATRFEGLGELAEWLASATLYIGNDSGITHLAAAVGTPTVALFGEASDPRVWAPRGRHVRVIARESLEAIDIDTVVEEVTNWLAGR
jgi:ADP-heptose:LPS heptosyltransferase